MRIEDAVIAERARYVNVSMPVIMFTNLVGGCATSLVFWRTIPPRFLALLVGIFAIQEMHCVFSSLMQRRTVYTPETAQRLFYQISGHGFFTSIIWSIAMYFFFPHGELIQQFAFMCAIVILGVATTIGFATYLPAFFWSFLPFSLSAIVIIATQEVIFYSALLSILLFIPMLVAIAILINRVMLGSLQLRFQNIELIAALTKQKDIAESAMLAKSRFLAAASHDLRQPIHALGLFIATLQAIAKLPELNREEIIHIATQQKSALSGLGRLLNGVLNVSRFDSGAVEVKKQTYFLRYEGAVLYNSFSGPAQEKGLALTIRFPPSISVFSDPTLLHQILSNLIANAVRYTERGRILVGCRPRGGQVEIQVWDTGIGIAADQLDKIFEEFYQVGNSARDNEMGLGLGLAIVRRSARMLEVPVDVKSNLGRGSLFSITLPRAVATAVPLEEQPSPLAAVRQRRKTVLVVDDDPEVREAVGILLSTWGHDVVPVATLEHALQAADTHFESIDLILADYRLADEVNGADVIRAVITALDRQVPASIITGDTSPDRIREATASGFNLLHKPLDPQILEALLHDC